MKLIPPGMTDSAFAEALERFAQVVGKEWVFVEQEDLDTYRDSYSPVWGEHDERLASAAVAPVNLEEVRAIVEIANDLEVPIYPISTGKNLGYGGAAPNLSGSVVIDLKRMNRIIEVDATRCFALVEPGVSYFDLHRYLEEHDIPLWIDCPEPGWGSVIGNALEHGQGYTHQAFRDHFGAHCGMEVVLPTGKVMRTGMGAMPGSSTWQDYRYGYGPYLDGLFSQANFGIVTKMGIHLMPRPEAMTAGVVEADRYEDITPLIHVLNQLEMSGLCDGLSQVTSPAMGTLGSPYNPEIAQVIGRPGGPKRADLDRIAQGKAFWNLRVLSYGPKEIATGKWEYAKKKFKEAVPNCRFIEEVHYDIPLTAEQEEALEPHRLDLDRKVNFAIPNLSIFSVGARSPAFPTPSDGHVWFSPIIPRSGEGIMEAQNVFCRALTELNAYVGWNAPLPLCYGSRYFLMILPVFVNKSDPKSNRKGIELLQTLITRAAEHGWGEYRAAPVLQDFIMDTYSFNDHALLRFCESLKDAADPKGILAAGRYGIWPAKMRSNSDVG